MLYRAIKKNEVFQSLKEEYDCAKEKERYYVNLFNKQDNLYSVFFVIFSLIIGAVYHITTLDGSEASAGILAFQDNELIISLLICALAIIYTYFYIIVQGNSYYLIIYSERIVVLEKCLNYYLGKKVYIWETEFMSKIQSKSNVLQKGYLNVNYIKTALAFLQYCIIHAGLVVMWFEINTGNVIRYSYIIIVALTTVFIAYNWIRMWFVLPSYYRQKLQKLYEGKLGIKLR